MSAVRRFFLDRFLAGSISRKGHRQSNGRSWRAAEGPEMGTIDEIDFVLDLLPERDRFGSVRLWGKLSMKK
jgi:hypothetical protein